MRKKPVEKLDCDLPVVMSKKLAESRYTMTLLERRLVFIAMSKIREDDMEFGEVRFTVPEYVQVLRDAGVGEVDNGELYKEIKAGAKSLASRLVEVETEDRWMAFQWLSKAVIEKKQGYVILRFHDDMKPYLLYMLENRGYTKFLLRYALPLTSLYAVRFFEKFRGLVWNDHPFHREVMTPDDIRTFVDIPENQYKRYVDLKRYVIEQAVKEINQKTDLMLSFRQKKGARNKVLSLTFTIKLKANMTQDWEKLAKWDEADLAEAIEDLIRSYKGQKISVPVSNPSNSIYREALAKFLWELREGIHDLSQIKNFQAWVNSRINACQDELDIRQTSIDEMVAPSKQTKAI
jgi:plasmid replication initiation protein